MIMQWGNTIKWNIFSNHLLIYSAKLTLSITLVNKKCMFTTLIPEVMYKTHDKLRIFLSSIGKDVSYNVYSWPSHKIGKLQPIWFYGVCSFFLRELHYFFIIIIPLISSHRYQPWEFSFLPTKAFRLLFGSGPGDYNKVFILFLLLFCWLGTHNIQVHIKHYSFPLVFI